MNNEYIDNQNKINNNLNLNIMLQIRITSYLLKKSVNILINSNRLMFTPVIMSRSLMIHKQDLEEVSKQLDRASIRFKITTT
jgi:hypothetical protein